MKAYAIKYLYLEIFPGTYRPKFSHSRKKIFVENYGKSYFLPTCTLNLVNWRFICVNILLLSVTTKTSFLLLPKNFWASHFSETSSKKNQEILTCFQKTSFKPFNHLLVILILFLGKKFKKCEAFTFFLHYLKTFFKNLLLETVYRCWW